ncbi:2'-5' RNA ligase family protein [Streptomyces sp. NPDC002917]|uniref:2'-5' RNA ligase family protein n=1 Tax=Streptomyces sp. NPDC002917 TaxID=3364671 RepID=UPI0036BD26F0
MTRRLGVALLPCTDHTRSAIRLQKEVGGDHSLQPSLSSSGNLPHLTIFQGPFTDALVPTRELAGIVGALKLPRELTLASTGIVYQATGWIFMSVERTALLDRLQEVALEALDPYLERTAFDTSKETRHFSDNERASFAKYGYRYTGDAYAPHITLGRTGEDVALELVRSAPDRTSVPEEWTFDRLSFYVMGEHGAHAEKLAERTLGGCELPSVY